MYIAISERASESERKAVEKTLEKEPRTKEELLQAIDQYCNELIKGNKTIMVWK